jgi:hypothetical protein
VKKPPLTPAQIQPLQRRYRELASQLGGFDSISQGSVMPQPPNAWRWTRKVSGKTITVGLVPAKAQQMKQAIANHRKLDKIIIEMREITQKLILQAPDSPQNPAPPIPPKAPLS